MPALLLICGTLFSMQAIFSLRRGYVLGKNGLRTERAVAGDFLDGGCSVLRPRSGHDCHRVRRVVPPVFLSNRFTAPIDRNKHLGHATSRNFCVIQAMRFTLILGSATNRLEIPRGGG
jgi:hypothetical protein